MENRENLQYERQKKSFFRKKVLLPLLCGVVLFGGAVTAAVLLGDPAPESVTVSTGMQHLANEIYLAASAPVGSEISFTPEWFDEKVGGGTVSAITLTALPPLSEGKLYLGHGEATLGQTVPRETVSYLKFIPADGVKKSSFCFVPTTLDGAVGYDLKCTLSLTDGKNCCPTEKGSVIAVSTHESLTLTGTLAAEDAEGDALYFEVGRYPENGALTVNYKTGAFTYTPAEDFCGTDSFTWRAQDEHGNSSAVATVNITVRELTTGYTFSDITDGNVQSAALRVSEKGLLGGQTVGGKHYFNPKEGVTRATFVAGLLSAAGIEAPEAESTGYADDADIPMGMKGAVLYAKEQGWLGDEENFRPNDTITRAEAAEIAKKALELAAPGYAETVRDFSAIPVHVADAIYALFEGGYITTFADGTLSPAAAMTKEDAARFFARVLDGKESA